MTTQFVKLNTTHGLNVDHSLMVAETDRDQLDDMTQRNPALRYIIEYGWKQSLKDKLAGYVKKYPNTTPDMLVSLMQKKADAIIAGTVTAREGSNRITDPVAREARRLAAASFKDDYTDQQRKIALTRTMQRLGVDEKKARAEIVSMLAATESIMQLARENLAKKAPVVDLADLFDDESDDEADDDNE